MREGSGPGATLAGDKNDGEVSHVATPPTALSVRIGEIVRFFGATF